jgi:predicted nucleotide-binding protein
MLITHTKLQGDSMASRAGSAKTVATPSRPEDPGSDAEAGEADPTVEPKRRTRVARAKPYPPTTLEAVLQIAEAIRKSGRKELGLVELARSLEPERSPGSSGFRVLVTGSADYGITRGNYKSEVISLTDRGMAYARPRDDSERSEAVLQAALAPVLFAKLYNEIAPGKWPSDANVENILVRDFAVAAEFAPEAAKIAKGNAQFVGLLQEAKGGSWLILNPQLRRIAAGSADDSAPVDSDAADVDQEEEADDSRPAVGAMSEVVAMGEATPPRDTRADAGSSDQVFVSHSKNPALLEQIKTILEFGRFVAIVAEEEETTAIPVPEKVLASMRRCGSAVISVSADESERRDDGSYGINQNVLIEIGAAFALYDRRVVLVVDKRVQLPSNLQGLYRSEYEGDELGWTSGMKLQKALTNFRER